MTITLDAATGSVSDRAVVFACDGNYARFALMAADQIARLAPERDFDICLCAAGETLAVPPGLAHLGIRVCRIEAGDIFQGLRLDKRRTEASYLRLALPAAFASEYRRLLYLDSDVFVQRGDFSALLDLDLGGRAIAAVRDNMQWRTPARRPEQFRRMGLSAAPFLNSGLLLIDTDAFNAQSVLDRCTKYGRDTAGRMTGLDQDLLNCVLHGDWAELSPAWNWQYTWASRLVEAMEDANIVHFIGPKKPWSHADGELPRRFRRAYRDFFAEHFPDAVIADDGLAPHQNRAFLRKMLVKHLLSSNKICAYLDRFETELTVHT